MNHWKSCVLVSIALCLAALKPASAQSPEELNRQAQEDFSLAAGAQDQPRFVPKLQEGQNNQKQVPQGQDLEPFDRFIKDRTKVLAGQGEGQVRATAQEVDLSALHNRHLKTSLKYSLGGKDVWISGAFDSSQNAYVSVLIDGQEARFFNVKGLLSKSETLDIGAGKYRLSLSPDLENQLESEIVLTNTANRKDQQRITIREMLGAVNEKGEEVRLTGQIYRLFYYDDIKDGQVNREKKLFTFIFYDAKGEIHIFLIPAELVPTDKIAVFKMFENKRVGLQQAGGRLRIFDNP